jgi:TolA-binding protein
MRGEFEKAAMTFSEFNSTYPGDARLVDTTMWIAESVSHFAPPEQACEIYDSLPQTIDTPPDTFLAQLSKLSDDANCAE